MPETSVKREFDAVLGGYVGLTFKADTVVGSAQEHDDGRIEIFLREAIDGRVYLVPKAKR